MRPTSQRRIHHGDIPFLQDLSGARRQIGRINNDLRFPFAFAVEPDTSSFGYLFPELQVPEALLNESRETRDGLINLGLSMSEAPDDPASDSGTPSAYTYFGQFVDHDITLEARSSHLARIDDPDLKPLDPVTIARQLRNGRTPTLDLDNVYYKPAPRRGSRMKLGFVSAAKDRPPGQDDANDLPRRPRLPNDPNNDRAALIGDARDDENLIISQLHVAFLRAHNAIAARVGTFDQARKLLRRHYQWIVVMDFLKRIADFQIVDEILNGGNRFFRPLADRLFMPLEFSVAAYRFGHSMVRAHYNYNDNFRGLTAATLAQLFTFTALSGRLGNFDTLPENWIIQWPNFLDEGTNHARAIDTRLTDQLFNLQSLGRQLPHDARLPVRNLLRGYLLRLPTGQAVASALGVSVMSPNEIEEIAESVSAEQLAAVRACDFSRRTPLWYYILAESAARHSSVLGPVGSTIVAEVLIGLVRNSKDSILRKREWKPSLGATPGRFTLRDLLRLGGVLN